MAKSKAIQKQEGQYLPMVKGVDHIRETLEVNLAGDDISPADLDRAINPQGKACTWTVPGLDGTEEEIDEIVGVIVLARTVRLYWKGKYKGAGTPPDCFSDNGRVGTGTPGGDCSDCPLSKFGSGPNNSQACKQIKQLFVLRPGELLPMIINCSPTNFGEAKRYGLRLSSRKQLKFHEAVTKISMVPDKSGSGYDYSKLVFQLVKPLDDDVKESMAAYREMFKPLLSGFSAAATAGADAAEEREPGSDDMAVDPAATDDDLTF